MKRLKRFGSVIMLSSLISLEAIAASNIDTTDKYAWHKNSGWLNFNATDGGVTVYDDHLEGYAFAENVGWIRLGTHTSGGTHNYTNDSNPATVSTMMALAISLALLGAKMWVGLNSMIVMVA